MKILMILSIFTLMASCTQKQEKDVATLVEDTVTVVEDIVEEKEPSSM